MIAHADAWVEEGGTWFTAGFRRQGNEIDTKSVPLCRAGQTRTFQAWSISP